MKIAILGTRGIPNHYGGFEQYAELLATYLVRKGWEVTVYNSSDHPYQQSEYQGVQIRHIKDPEQSIGTVGQFLYDLRCILDTRKEHFDIVYQLGYTSSSVFNFLFPRGTLIVTNMDGLEWKRSKYNKAVQRFLRYAEKVAIKRSHHLIADSIGIQSYLREKYNAGAFYSAYTATIPDAYDPLLLQPYHLEAGRYNLLIARLEPENNIETIIDAHISDAIQTPLVIIGNIHTQYGSYLVSRYAAYNGKIRFAGSIYDKVSLDSIRHYACIYFHGHSVGGTNPSLLEAMACGCHIMAHDNIFNRGVLEDAAWYFKDSATLRDLIIAYDGDIPDFFAKAARHNTDRIRQVFSEDHIFAGLTKQLNTWFKNTN